tara:strand:+ start:684 stop:926 length:243 start_codon:yes stop_codon:yes gene_type:complete
MSEERLCKICGKKLRPLLKQEDYDQRVYHVTCFDNIIKDLNNFGKVAYTKYNYKKKVNNMTIDDAKKHLEAGNKFVIEFA